MGSARYVRDAVHRRVAVHEVEQEGDAMVGLGRPPGLLGVREVRILLQRPQLAEHVALQGRLAPPAVVRGGQPAGHDSRVDGHVVHRRRAGDELDSARAGRRLLAALRGPVGNLGAGEGVVSLCRAAFRALCFMRLVPVLSNSRARTVQVTSPLRFAGRGPPRAGGCQRLVGRRRHPTDSDGRLPRSHIRRTATTASLSAFPRCGSAGWR